MNSGEIEKLIALKQEGEYWDFKREWYSINNTSDLLHDIICMANNMADRDAYIIIGVDEEEDYAVRDVSQDENRRSTQQIVDFLRSKNFAGDVRPIVFIETVEFEEGKVDVIVIKKSDHTPFYLTKEHKGVKPYHIYTRVQDTNTPKDSSAAIKDVEYLWKKRFKLLVSPLEKVKYLLTRKDEWVRSPLEYRMAEYHSVFPEYQIEHVYDKSRDGYEYYLFSQTDKTPHWYDINIFFHQTMLASFGGVALDGGRYFTSTPDKGFISLNHCNSEIIYYRYYLKNSLNYIIHGYFSAEADNYEARLSKEKFLECAIIYDSVEEKTHFESYVKEKWKHRELYAKKCNLPYFPEIEGYNMDTLIENYENAKILKMMYQDFLEDK